LLGFIFVILIVASVFLAYKIFVPYNIGDELKTVMITEDSSFADAIRALDKQGVIRDSYLFRQIAVLTGIDHNIAPGRYDFLGRISLYSILKKFHKHEIATLLVTVPEGLIVPEIASILKRELQVDSELFCARAYDTSFTGTKYGYSTLEGYLFPETYKFWFGIEIDNILDIMLEEFNEQNADVLKKPAPNNLDPEEVVILASIIEAEASKDGEMGLVSSVYHNRLERRIMLQADPTVIYGLGGLDRPLNRRDIRLSDSPYNTYKHYGLPPGPINSPGGAAINAAVNPKSSDFLYFVADGTGKHIFSRTLKEHNLAKREIARKLKGN
jgi:UPF0755 protein